MLLSLPFPKLALASTASKVDANTFNVRGVKLRCVLRLNSCAGCKKNCIQGLRWLEKAPLATNDLANAIDPRVEAKYKLPNRKTTTRLSRYIPTAELHLFVP